MNHQIDTRNIYYGVKTNKQAAQLPQRGCRR